MRTEISIKRVLERIMVKFTIELIAGSVAFILLSCIFDFKMSPSGDLGSLLFGTPLLLLFASAATFYLPFSIIIGILLNSFKAVAENAARYSVLYAGICILYVLAGLFYVGWEASAAAIGMSLIFENLLFAFYYFLGRREA